MTNNVEELVRNRNIKTIATHVKHIISKYVVEPLPRHSFDIKSHGTQEKLTNIYKRKQKTNSLTSDLRACVCTLFFVRQNI